jgi:hypothetical protein
MTSLPKYYFQDISSELMGEIMDEVAETRPESTLEELDQWAQLHRVLVQAPEILHLLRMRTKRAGFIARSLGCSRLSLLATLRSSLFGSRSRSSYPFPSRTPG